MGHDVFISYAKSDFGLAEKICQVLESVGVPCWIAPRNVPPGDDYGGAIVNAIGESRLMVLILSEASNVSPQVLREIERAVSKRVPIVPLRIEKVTLTESLEYFLSSPQWLNAMTPPLEQHFPLLIETVRRVIAARSHVPTPAAPPASPPPAAPPAALGGYSPGNPTYPAPPAAPAYPAPSSAYHPPQGYAPPLPPAYPQPPAQPYPPPAAAPPAPAMSSATAPLAEAANGLHVAILYKRNAQPDETVLALLEGRLRAAGFGVFIDRHMSIGVEWAKEIERQIRTVDAVVPLLSAASIHSEMLNYEVQLAQEESQRRNGKPHLFPVRLNFSDPLPPNLSGALDRWQYFLWRSADDNERLVHELIAALRNPQPLKEFRPPGGVVPLDSELYVHRPTDDEFNAAIARQDGIVLVKGARQMGKTSLLARGLQQARKNGARVIVTDFQRLNASDLESPEKLFLALGAWIADQLELDVVPEDVWDNRRGPSVNFERFLRRQVLNKIEQPLVWGLDEVDRLFPCGFGSEVFGLFRSWYNERGLDPSGPWSRLTMAIGYATESHLFIADMNQSPFNVGTRIALEDFTLAQVSTLNQRYNSPLRSPDELHRFYQLLGGHPYLANRGMYELISRGMTFDELEKTADRDEGILGDHLRRMLILLAQDRELEEVVRSVLSGRPQVSAESFYRLRSAGVMAGDFVHEMRPRCALYANYLRRHLVGR